MENQPTRRVAVVTGASSGIGRETAKALISQGWRVIGLGRNPQRCKEAEAELQALASFPKQAVMICADLALLADAKKAAREIASLTDRVDALLNNAGGLTDELKITPEGNENTFASNHLGAFVLTTELLPLLKAAAAITGQGTTRIVNVSSAAHQAIDGLDWDDLQSINNFASMTAYCRVKLANILFTTELAKRVASDGIVVHAMHPGLVASNFFNHGDDSMKGYLDGKEDSAKSPKDAADTLIWLATSPEAGETSGGYFFERNIIPASSAASNPANAERLWLESEKLVAQSL